MCGVSGWGFGGDLKKTPRDVLEAQANILVVITHFGGVCSSSFANLCLIVSYFFFYNKKGLKMYS